jgi:hypothetical protein
LAPLAGEDRKIFMVAITALPGQNRGAGHHTPRAGNDLLELGSLEPVRLFEPLLVDLRKGLKMVHHTAVLVRRITIVDVKYTRTNVITLRFLEMNNRISWY